MTKKYQKEVVNQLKSLGFKHIKRYSLSTWKYYGEDHVRLTYLVTYDNKKYIIKATRGFEIKSTNSVRFQELFNDKFDFIPKGKTIDLKGYICQMTEYIDSYSFDEAALLGVINEKNIDIFLKQSLSILEELAKENIVHCDLVSVNLLIEKKTNKMYLIDWDTVCSYKHNLISNAFPDCTTKRKTKDGYVYDDAYSFRIVYDSLSVKDLPINVFYKEICGMVDKNCFLEKSNKQLNQKNTPCNIRDIN